MGQETGKTEARPSSEGGQRPVTTSDRMAVHGEPGPSVREERAQELFDAGVKEYRETYARCSRCGSTVSAPRRSPVKFETFSYLPAMSRAQI